MRDRQEDTGLCQHDGARGLFWCRKNRKSPQQAGFLRNLIPEWLRQVSYVGPQCGKEATA